jgi:hypothetical protein
VVAPTKPSRRRIGRAVAVVAVVAFGATATVALATDNLHPKPKAAVIAPLAGTSGGSPGATASTPAASAGSGGSDASTGGAPLAASTGPADDVGAVAARSPGPAASTPGPAPGPALSTAPSGSSTGPTTTTTAAPGTASPAVVSGVLDVFAFGSEIGLPLLCGVAVGAAGPALADPALAQVATTIGSSCTSFGNEGSAALTKLDQQLSALAAANPAVDPVVDGIASIFNGAGSDTSIPFADEMTELGQLVQFFGGSGT